MNNTAEYLISEISFGNNKPIVATKPDCVVRLYLCAMREYLPNKYTTTER